MTFAIKSVGPAKDTARPPSDKSLLAKLLATENISIQRSAQASTAAFDIKNRVLILPVWKGISDDLEDMLVVHEVGHALDTPANDWLPKIEKICEKVYGKVFDNGITAIKGFMNVIEDARIDKRQKRRYPGSKRNYLIGYKELIDRDFFGTATRELNSFGFIDRINMYFKGGFNSGIKFSNEEMPFVKRIEAAETFAEVVQLTEEIFQFCKEKGEEQLQKQDEIQFGEGEGSEKIRVHVVRDEDGYFDLGDSDGSFEFEDEDDGDEDGSNSSDGEGDEDSDEEQKGNQYATTTAGECIPESQTEKSWQSRQKEILTSDNVEYHYVTVPKAKYNTIVKDYKFFLDNNRTAFTRAYGPDWMNVARQTVTQFRNEDNATISFMVKEFEMKKSADIFSRISIAKTGVIDTNKIYSYKYNDDIFRRQSIIPQGKNHGFVMVLDWSGSMSGNIRETIKQLISLTSFCKRTQIPFEVYIFRDRSGQDYTTHNAGCFEHTTGDMVFNDFTMQNILSSRMKQNELLEAYTLLWCLGTNYYVSTEPMGGTPLNHAIVATEEIVNRFKVSSKAQIVNVIFLTDGDSNQVGSIHNKEISRYNVYGKKINNHFILQDKKTGKDYHFVKNEGGAYLNGKEVTVNLLKRLKDRTGVNLIGFYLYEGNGNSAIASFYGYMVDPKFQETLRNSWNTNKFIPVTSHGYDDYYIINTNAMKNTQNDLSVDSTMTKAKIAREFMKFSEKKSINRILLKRFIEKVA